MKSLGIVLISVAFSFSAMCQLEITSNISDQTLTDWIQGTDVLVTNLVVECDSGAYGTFTNSIMEGGLDVEEGILFSTGYAVDAIGPNDMGGTSGNVTGSASGDVDLEVSLSGFSVYNVCRVEFDVQPLYQFLIFNYVFGSEEYPEFVGSGFNDVFGFFVSGPGIAGSFSNGASNYSNVPGTDLPVAINNVNGGLNTQYYIDNLGGAECQYDGLTTNLPGIIEVQPNESYHVKIAVGDAGDSVFDSGVFLQKESFMSVPSIVGIEELDNLNLEIFPNPTSEFLSVNGDDLQSISNYQMLNIEGKVVQSGSLSGNYKIDVRVLSNGTYTMVLLSGSQVAASLNWIKK